MNKNEHHSPRIESLIKQSGLHNRMHLAGWRRDIPTVMKVFDAFLLTSHWEGLPRVLLEARTIGLPVADAVVRGKGNAGRVRPFSAGGRQQAPGHGEHGRQAKSTGSQGRAQASFEHERSPTVIKAA